VESARTATADDIDRILVLADALRAEFAAHRGGELWTRTHDPVRHAAPELRALLGQPDDRVLVGCIDDAVVGYAIVRTRVLADGAQLGTITEVYVEPGAREVGVGECMTASVVDWCAARGCIGVDTTALPGHRAAKNFFEEHGFVARSLTMHRPLAAPLRGDTDDENGEG
jgi:GNAT superfamily N-acetyltransferase